MSNTLISFLFTIPTGTGIIWLVMALARQDWVLFGVSIALVVFGLIIWHKYLR